MSELPKQVTDQFADTARRARRPAGWRLRAAGSVALALRAAVRFGRDYPASPYELAKLTDWPLSPERRPK